MTSEHDSPSRDAEPPPPKSVLTTVLDVLGSLRFALLLVVLITVACIVGTMLPQGAQVGKYLAKNPGAASRMEFLTALGLTRVYSCWWFIGLLCVLSASLSVCTVRRYLASKRVRGNARWRVLGSMVTHLSILLILLGGVIRGAWGQKGYVELREGQTADAFQSRTGLTPLPFSVHLVDFEMERYEPQDAPKDPQQSGDEGTGTLIVQWPGEDSATELPAELEVERILAPGSSTDPAEEVRVKVLRYVPDFVVDMSTKEVGTRSDVPRNPAIFVSVADTAATNTYWLFSRYPDFNMHGADETSGERPRVQLGYRRSFVAERTKAPEAPIKDWKSSLQLLEGGQVVREKTIEVNVPLSYKGYTFYQSSYDPDDLTYTALQVVRDPGVPVVYAGFALMIVGLTIVFYVYPWLNTRKRKSGGTA